MKSVTFSADDFGLSEAVNDAVERAYRDGVLQAASLMVAAPAAGHAVQIARRNPGLRVGLHLVVIEGPSVLTQREIPGLVNAYGQFSSDQLGLGISYFFRRTIRRQLAAEIAAQFAAFAATGLPLDHANAHKHMHLHPTIGAMMLRIGRAHRLSRVRIPAEPPSVLADCGYRPSRGDRVLYQWTKLLRHQAVRAGMEVNDHCFGLAWSGHMTAERVKALLARLPDGNSEIYFHPATRSDGRLRGLMPEYEHEAELAALLDPGVKAAAQALQPP